jgi:hypothetical protein
MPVHPLGCFLTAAIHPHNFFIVEDPLLPAFHFVHCLVRPENFFNASAVHQPQAGDCTGEGFVGMPVSIKRPPQSMTAVLYNNQIKEEQLWTRYT